MRESKKIPVFFLIHLLSFITSSRLNVSALKKITKIFDKKVTYSNSEKFILKIMIFFIVLKMFKAKKRHTDQSIVDSLKNKIHLH